MNNNDADNVNPEGKDSLLQYSEGMSYTSRSNSLSPSEGLAATSQDNPPPVQYESRKARRLSETSMMKAVPVPVEVPTLSTLTPSTPKEKVTTDTAIVAPKEEEPKAVTDITPVAPEPVTNVPAPVSAYNPMTAPAPSFLRAPKEYWGGIAMLSSFVVFLVTQVVATIALVAYIIFGNNGNLEAFQNGTTTLENIIGATPWLLVLTQGLMYASWLGCMWWVTRYRSGVQRGKKFWVAFADNFRLRSFKWWDALYGVGIAGVMVGLQFFVLNVLPSIFPVINTKDADNTVVFQSIDGLWFYVLAFGLGGFVGPICEELFFRGFLLRGFENHFSYKNSGRNMDILEDGLAEKDLGVVQSMVSLYRAFTHKYRYILSAVITSILFGLIHFQGGTSLGSWLTVIFTGLLGLVFAFVTLKLNRIYPAMIAHVLYNSTLFFLLSMTK
jgi:membrane protease YdiL (CAAX protease family)